jgi:hypothetical protein
MKKLIITITTLAVSCSAFFMACNKNEVKKAEQSTLSIQDDLTRINRKHIPKYELIHMTEEEKSARTAATIAADALGAADGALVGSLGGPFLAGFAAGIGGTTASYAMWKSLTHDLPVGDVDDMVTRLNNHAGNYAVANPYGNPYENVGQRHNVLLRKLVLRIPELPVTNNMIVFDNTDLNQDEIGYLAGDNNHTINAYNYLLATPTPSCYDYLNSFASAQQDVVVKDALTLFLNGLNPINNLSARMAFINDYENYFINNSTITARDKQILLQSFATAKHSSAFWYSVFDMN